MTSAGLVAPALASVLQTPSRWLIERRGKRFGPILERLFSRAGRLKPLCTFLDELNIRTSVEYYASLLSKSVAERLGTKTRGD